MIIRYPDGDSEDHWEETETDRLVVKSNNGQPVAGVIDHKGQIVVSTCDEADFGELMACMGQEEVGQTITVEFGD